MNKITIKEAVTEVVHYLRLNGYKSEEITEDLIMNTIKKEFRNKIILITKLRQQNSQFKKQIQ